MLSTHIVIYFYEIGWVFGMYGKEVVGMQRFSGEPVKGDHLEDLDLNGKNVK
jgi:hypothetical protein